MSRYLQALTLAAGLLAATAVHAQESVHPGASASNVSVELAQYQHYGHWDVYYLWYGHEVYYGSYASHAEADHWIWHLTVHYHVYAYHRYHY